MAWRRYLPPGAVNRLRSARRDPTGFLFCATRRTRAPAWWRALATTAAMALCAAAATANDRPYEWARTAVAEDDDQTWSLESWVSRIGSVRSVSVEPEYTFDPHHSVQMEFSRLLDRLGQDTGHAAEVEYKYLFNRIDRDGWGLGIGASAGAERRAAEHRSVGELTLRVPLSIALGESGGHLHLNAGWARRSVGPSTGLLAAALDYTVARRTLLFVETAAQRGERHAQFGVRWWLRREKLALDAAWVRSRVAGETASGVIFGIGVYDM